MRRVLTLTLSALALGTAPGGAAEGRAITEPSPSAPPQTAQYAFLIGDWACETWSTSPGGAETRGRARWHAYYILGGWAIQDEWRSRTPSGAEAHGTNVRSFDPERGVWNNRWLASGALRWVHFDSEWTGETMVMTGGEGRDAVGDYVDRNTFHDIAASRFAWRKDRSYDEGKSWVEGVARITCTRAS